MLVRLLLGSLGFCAAALSVGVGWAAGAALGLVACGASFGGVVVFMLMADVFPEPSDSKQVDR